MKKRIRGLEYNTGTAKKIAECSSSYGVNDNQFYKETLYRKRTGEFFVHGVGNAGSKYAEWLPDYHSYTSGEAIKPLTFDEAKEWYTELLNDGSGDEKQYKELFQPKDSPEKVSLTLSVSKRAKKGLLDLATKQGKSQSEIVERLILSEIDL